MAARGRSKKKGILFDLEFVDITIPETCPLLGIPLRMGKRTAGFDSPTLDRIDPSKGYVKGNVWVISRRANMIKSDASIEEIEMVARKLRAFLDSHSQPHEPGVYHGQTV